MYCTLLACLESKYCNELLYSTKCSCFPPMRRRLLLTQSGQMCRSILRRLSLLQGCQLPPPRPVACTFFCTVDAVYFFLRVQVKRVKLRTFLPMLVGDFGGGVHHVVSYVTKSRIKPPLSLQFSHIVDHVAIFN